MDYSYSTQLGPTEIRLLEVAPQRGSVDLHFRAKAFSRNTCPEYTAVSYTWGDEQATHKIFLDGAAFRIRPNLWHCLYNLARFASKENSMISRLHIWVDAICINQANLQERNDQVRKMDETYRDARIVSVWLGLVPNSPSTSTLRLPDKTLLSALDVDDLDWRSNALELANRPYWNRFWVIQEMLLATDVYLFCGNTAVEITEFKSMLCSETGISEFSHDVQQDQMQRSPALPLIIGRSPDRYPELYDTLQTLLSRHSQADCKDPRDRVYALIGLVSPDERQLLLRFFPNYSLSEEEVLILTLAHLTQIPWTELKSEDLLQDVVLDSSKVFSALKIASETKRRNLVQRTNEIDWIGLETRESLKFQLELSAMLHSPMPSDPAPPRLREIEAMLHHRYRERHRDNTAYGTLERASWDSSEMEIRDSRTKIYVRVIIVLIGTLAGSYWYGMLPHLPFGRR